MVDVLGVIITIVVLIIAWIIVSIPLWLAAKVVTGGSATMGGAMIGMLGGVIVFAVVYLLTFYVTNIFISAGYAVIVAAILAFLAFLALFKGLFDVGWLGAFGIAILAVVFAFILLFIAALVLGALGGSLTLM
ncbi:MAG TPA: hypothetical protein VMS79_01780 [Methanomassiliicoccales archaeon]|nr:hypothetical protein [Methanomassiliicoccales archaeon]